MYSQFYKKIFYFLPIPVCKLWQLATLKHWKNLTELLYYGYDYPLDNDDAYKPIAIISAVDARKIMLNVAPFIKELQTDFTYLKAKDGMSNIMFASWRVSYTYTVPSFKVESILKLLTKKATKLYDVSFDKPPEADVVRLLFEANNIRQLTITDPSNDWFRNISTNGIELLELKFNDATTDIFFQGVKYKV